MKSSPRWKLFVLSLLALASAIRAAPQSPPQADLQRLAEDAAWLADDAREGRRAGTAAARGAADWIAARFAALGLTPAGEPVAEGATWFQEFSVPLPARDGGKSVLEVFARARMLFQAPAEVAPLFCSEGGEVRGKPVFRGYGIVNPEQAWDDYGEEKLAGAVVVVLRGTPPVTTAPKPEGAAPPAHAPTVEPGAGWGSSGSIFSKVMTAKRFGAAAVLVVQSLDDLKEPPMRFDASQQARAGIPALAISGQTFRSMFKGPDVKDMRERLDKREPPGPLVVRDRREAHVVADVHREKGPAFNVLGLLKGEDAGGAIVVGAHYDHLGRGGEGSLAPDALGEIHNGADDNASGTAVVLEVARLLSAGPKPKRDVLFALWSGEELGLLGSEHWAQHPTVPIERVRANLNLDMVGRAGPKAAGTSGGNGEAKCVLSILGAGTAAPFESWMAEAGKAAEIDLKVSLSGQGVGGSDHMTFLKRKIPALHLFSGVHSDYHKPSDDTDKLDIEGMRRVAVLGVDLVRRMQAAEQLAWVEPPSEKKEASERAAASGFRVWFGSVPEYTFEGKGVLLAGTSAGSPAEKAGLLKGDVLLQVGDVVIDTIHDFTYALGLYKPGDVVLARYLRDGQEESVRITLATRAKE